MASRLDEIDRAILGCYNEDLNITPKVIANKIGIHYTNVYKRLKRPALAVTEVKGSLIQILADGKRLAAKKMKRLVMSSNEHVALKASVELLKADLSGETTQQQPVRFITVVNEVGVLESSPAPTQTIDLIPAVVIPTDKDAATPNER